MSSSQDKNLPATERKLQKARSDGQAARSRDLSHLAILGMGAGLAQIKCDSCTHSMRHDRIPRDKTRRMECVHYRVKDRSIAA